MEVMGKFEGWQMWKPLPCHCPGKRLSFFLLFRLAIPV